MKRLLPSLVTIGLLATVFALSGCDLTELNDNPNQATDATPGELLTNAQLDFAEIYWRDYPGAYWMRYAQYLTTNQYTTGDRFGFPSSRVSSNNFNFNQAYLVLNDLQEIIRMNQNSPDETSFYGPPENQIAMAKVMQAFVYQYLTDQYGPIPFTDALQGQSENNFSPAYSSQEEVYNGILTMLTDASNSIQTDATAMASGDLIYGGDGSKWKKFANALKMRVAMRMSEVDASTAQTALQEAVAAGAFESNEDNAAIPFNASPPHQNEIYGNYNDGRDDWAAPQAITTVMNNTQDPRRPAFFADANPDQPGHQTNGFPYGLRQADAQALFTDPDENFSRPSQLVRQPDFPSILMQYDEVQFIKAEAALRNDLSVGITSTPDALYKSAITASLKRWGVTSESEINSFIGGLTMPSNRSGTRDDFIRKQLGVQKWVAQYLQGMQGWSTWRRLDFQGVLQIPPGNPGQDAFTRDYPVRMTYPADEETLNGSNLDAAIDMLDGDRGDSQGTLLWWDDEYKSPQP